MVPLDPNARPIDHVLCGAANAPALIDRAGEMTFAQAEARVARLAGWLARAVPKAGARVATWLPKTREACLMPLAAARAGLVHVPINPALKRAQVGYILADSVATLLLTQAARAATLEAGDVPDATQVHVEAGEGEALPPSDADPDALAAILYTSGSTGRPKGVMLSHANLWLGAVSVARLEELAADDEFHAVAVEASANPYIAAVLEQVTPVLRRLERIRFASRDGRHSVALHEQIIARCEAGDSEGAGRAARDNWHTLIAAQEATESG